MEKSFVKIDSLGRIVIPKKIRKSFSINSNSVLNMEIANEEIYFKIDKNVDNKNTINKIKILERLSNLKFIVLDNNQIIYSTKILGSKDKIKVSSIKEVLSKENESYNGILKITDKLSVSNYYYSILNLNNYTKILVIVIYSEKQEKSLAKIVAEFL